MLELYLEKSLLEKIRYNLVGVRKQLGKLHIKLRYYVITNFL